MPRRLSGAPVVASGMLCLALCACGTASSHGAASSSPRAASSPTSTGSPGPSAASPTTASPTTASPTTPSPTTPSHIFVVVMENLGAQAALGVPALAQLARRYQSTTSWYALAHPSLPNYLGLVSGSTWAVDSDCTSCFQSGANLGAQLSAAGVSWDAYFEGMPGPCFLGPQSADGSYAQKHDPFAYFDDIRSDPALCAHLQPLTSLTPLLSGPAGAVPRFVWVTPSMCHSGHDCSPTVAGDWLSGFVGQVTASSAWRSDGMLVVTWDEGDTDTSMNPHTGEVSPSGGGGPVLTLVAVPGAPAGRVLPGPYDHYSLLRTVESTFGLPLLGQASAPSVAPLTAFLDGAR